MLAVPPHLHRPSSRPHSRSDDGDQPGGSEVVNDAAEGSVLVPQLNFRGLFRSCARGASFGLQGSELAHHAKVVPDRPALGDASVDEAVDEHDLPGIGALG